MTGRPAVPPADSEPVSALVGGGCDECGQPGTISVSFVRGLCEGEEHLRDLAREAGDTEAAAFHGHTAQLLRAALAARGVPPDKQAGT